MNVIFTDLICVFFDNQLTFTLFVFFSKFGEVVKVWPEPFQQTPLCDNLIVHIEQETTDSDL